MAYTPINEARFEVRVTRGFMHDKHFYWTANVKGDTGISHIYSALISGGNFATPELAEADFKDFANVNQIKDFVIFKYNL